MFYMNNSKYDQLMEHAVEDIKEGIKLEKRKKWIEKFTKDNPELTMLDIKNAADKAEKQGEFNHKGILKIKHERGFIVMDFEGFKSLPKSQQSKIMKIGEI